MSAAGINLAIAAVLALAAIVLFRLCRTPKPTERQRGAAARKRVGLTTVWDFAAEAWVDLPYGAEPGPGQMTRRQLEEADKLELLWLAPAYTHPDLDPGIPQQRSAIRDEGEAV